jgi:hypothetical protein
LLKLIPPKIKTSPPLQTAGYKRSLFTGVFPVMCKN